MLSAESDLNITLALEHLFTSVRDHMAGEDVLPAAAHRFGWRERSRQNDGQPAVVWIPGDPDGGLGALTAPKYPGQEPARPLLNLGELFTIIVSGSDARAPADELAQYKATRILYDALIRALYLTAHGTFGITRQRWVRGPTERQWGTAIEITGLVQAVIPDLAVGIAPADTDAIVTSTNITDPSQDSPHPGGTPDPPDTYTPGP